MPGITSRATSFTQPLRKSAAIVIRDLEGIIRNLTRAKADVEKPKEPTDSKTVTTSSVSKADTYPDKESSSFTAEDPRNTWQGRV